MSKVPVMLDREQAEKLAQDYGTADGAEDCGCPACRIAKDVRAALRKQPAEKLGEPDQAQDSLPVEEGDVRPSTDSCPYCGKDDCQSVERWRDRADYWWRVAEEWADRTTDRTKVLHARIADAEARGAAAEKARWEARIEKLATWEDRAWAEQSRVARWHEESGSKMAREVRDDEYRHGYTGRVLRSLLTGEGDGE